MCIMMWDNWISNTIHNEIIAQFAKERKVVSCIGLWFLWTDSWWQNRYHHCGAIFLLSSICWQRSWDTLWIFKNCPDTTAETVNMLKRHFSEAEHSYCSSSGELLWWCHQYARLFVWYSDPGERSKLTLNVCTLLQSFSGYCTAGSCTWGESSRRTKLCAWCYCANQKIS